MQVTADGLSTFLNTAMHKTMERTVAMLDAYRPDLTMEREA